MSFWKKLFGLEDNGSDAAEEASESMQNAVPTSTEPQAMPVQTELPEPAAEPPQPESAPPPVSEIPVEQTDEPSPVPQSGSDAMETQME